MERRATQPTRSDRDECAIEASEAMDPEVASETAEAIDEILANKGHSDQANRNE